MKISFICKWYDFWVGLFWDQAKRRLYVLPIPCIGFVVEFGGTASPRLKRNSRGFYPPPEGLVLPKPTPTPKSPRDLPRFPPSCPPDHEPGYTEPPLSAPYCTHTHYHMRTGRTGPKV